MVVHDINTSHSKTLQILQDHQWCGLSRESQRMIYLFQGLNSELSQFQITLLINRYISIVESLSKRTTYFAIQFHVGRTIITVGSLFVSSLLSIQYINTGNSTTSQSVPSAIFWITWFLSLLVTICNGVLTLFKVDKKYYFLHTTMESLKSEAWQYLHLTGKYGGHYTKGQMPTHENQYIYFCHNIEKIKLKQVEEEYYKLIDSNDGHEKHPTASRTGLMRGESSNAILQNGGSKKIAGLYMPTPEQQELLIHQKELANALVANGVSLFPKVDGKHSLQEIKNKKTPSSKDSEETIDFEKSP